jgi:FtsZ-binding cell division protein ZapB
MTPTDPDATDLERERARSAAAIAALQGELDAAHTEHERLLGEIETLRAARAQDQARAEAAEAEVAGLRATRAVRWATRLRAVLGR